MEKKSSNITLFYLLFCSFIAHISPTPISILTNTSKTAWEYVCYGIEASLLWAFTGVLYSYFSLKYKLVINFLCIWGFVESIQRPICRLWFPMNKAPELLLGQNLCDAATGMPLSLIGLIFALFITCLIQELNFNSFPTN